MYEVKIMKNKSFIFILLFIGIAFLFFSYIINADDTGYQSPQNYGAFYDEWGAPENAFSQDDTYATTGTAGQRMDDQDYYEFSFDDVWDDIFSTYLTTPCPIINGIVIEFDGYGNTNIYYDIKLSWNSGSSWTSAQSSATLPASDTDTYIVVGGSTDNWGRTWTYNEFSDSTFIVYFKHIPVATWGYIDHIRVKIYYTLEKPSKASCVIINLKPNQCNNNVSINWIKGSGADYTLIKYGTISYPTLSTGTQVYNGTGQTIITYSGFGYCSEFYIGFWSWNTTYCSYSSILQHYWVSPCNNNITKYENIINASGYHQSQYNCFTGWKVWANYSSAIVLYQNIVNATGTHEYVYSDFMEYYKVWANYTGNETGGDCELKYLNFTDNNITINITYWGCNSTNTSNYEVNEDNWLSLAGTLLFDNSQVFLLLIVGLWLYFLSKYYEKGLKIHALIQVGFMIPLVISIAIFALDFIFGYIIIFVIPIYSIYVAYEGFVYGKN